MFWVLGTARARVRLVVVVVPEDVGTYVCDHIGVEPPTETVQGVKGLALGVASVNPVSVIVAVVPRTQAALRA